MRSSLSFSGAATFTLALLLAVSSTAMSGRPARGSADLLLDESFEAGTDGWVADGGTLDATSTLVHTGTHSALVSAEINGTIRVQYQPVPVRPASDYSLSAFVFKDDPQIESITLRARWQDENGAYIDWTYYPATLYGDEPSWRSLTYDQQSPPDAAFVVILVLVKGSEQGSFYLDDLTLEGPPPLPPTETPAVTDTPSPGLSPTSTPAAATSTPTRIASATPTANPTPTAGVSGSLVNVGFEEADDGVLKGWQKYGGDLWQTSRQHRSGGHSGELISNTDSTKWAFQEIAVTGDTAYQFDSYVLLNDPAVQEVFLRVSWYVSDDAGGSAIAVSDSPQRLSGSDATFRYLTTGPALAPPAARSARLRIMLAPVSSAPATIYIDDASFQQVSPEVAAIPALPPPAEEVQAPVDASQPKGAARAQRSASNAAGQPLPPQGESPYPVKLNEVMFDPAPAGDDAELEWLELYNAGAAPVDLTGWTLSDNSAADTLPSLTLASRGYVVIAASVGFRDAYPAFDSPVVFLDDRIGTGLANAGDRLLLRDSSGKLADGISWGDDEAVLSPSVAVVPSSHSIERSPTGHDTDAAADFVDNASPSPGRGIGEQVVAGATARREVAGSSVVYPPPMAVEEASNNLLQRFLVSVVAGVVALAASLSAGLYGRRQFRQWP